MIPLLHVTSVNMGPFESEFSEFGVSVSLKILNYFILRFLITEIIIILNLINRNRVNPIIFL